jgi:hypothetical protein
MQPIEPPANVAGHHEFVRAGLWRRGIQQSPSASSLPPRIRRTVLDNSTPIDI